MVIERRVRARPRCLNELQDLTGKGVRVGVIDSGWDRALRDPQVGRGVGLVNTADEFELLYSEDDNDRIGHGTACTDLILQIAPGAEIIPIRVFGRSLETSVHVIYAGLVWAVEKRLSVINLSLGTILPEARDMLYVVCEAARRNNVIIVAAGPPSGELSFPAVFDNVIGVTAAKFDSPYHYSYHDDEAIECAAKGYDQRARTLGGRTFSGNGTSLAAPNITGVVAMFRERNPQADLDEVRKQLASFAVNSS